MTIPTTTRTFHWDDDHCYADDFMLSCDDESEARAEFALRTYLDDWTSEIHEFKGDYWLVPRGKVYTVTGDIDKMVWNQIWKDVLHPLEDSDPALSYAVDPFTYINARIKRDGYAKILGKKVTDVESYFIIEDLQ